MMTEMFAGYMGMMRGKGSKGMPKGGSKGGGKGYLAQGVNSVPNGSAKGFYGGKAEGKGGKGKEPQWGWEGEWVPDSWLQQAARDSRESSRRC